MIAQLPCVHRWLIEPPAGPTSLGRCVYCGAVRSFSNLDVSIWGTYAVHRPRRAPGHPFSKKGSIR